MELSWHLYIMAGIYILAGLNHFRNPKMYARIIPHYIPYPKQINYLSGLAEIFLGITLCLPMISSFAAWEIIALLIAIFPANVYMLTNEKASFRLPKWLLILRLPLQIVLIIWAYIYT